MKWEEIVKNCPNAFYEYHKFCYGDVAYSKGKYAPIVVKNLERDQTNHNNRDLYEFFDKNYIMILIERNNISSFWFDFNYIIYTTNDGKHTRHFGGCHIRTPRITAEQLAFEEAFRLLEERLS